MTPQTQDLIDRLRWAQAHPVIGLAALSPDTVVTKTPGVAQRLVEHVNAARPDMAEEIKRRLQPVKRTCPHCGTMTPKNAERCERCGKFVPDLHRTLKAEVDALLDQPDPGEARTRLGPGAIATHTPTGFVGRLLTITLDRRAILRDPSGQTITVPYSEIEALGGVAAQPPPSHESEGGFQGRPATHTPSDLPSDSSYVPMGMRTGSAKAAGSGTPTKARCANCERELTEEDLEDGECPQCGADLTADDALEPAAKAGYYASPAGMLKLWRSTRRTDQPGGVFGRSSAAGSLRKGGIGLVRGTRVRSKRSGRRGVVLGSNGLTCAVEYTQGQVTSTVVEKASELERL
jgi:predicted RNA-binding Zn-ribbon protein involved in translation (DUF1610 family)